jgi:hypothetical protein
MDALVDNQEEIDAVFAGLLRPLVDQELAVVFYDMTTIRTGGLSQQPDDIRKFGMAKEGLIARHVMLGVVQTAEGLSSYQEVLEGNTAEVTTLKSTLKKIVQRFPVKRIIAVVDRGLLSTNNLSGLQPITLPDGAALEFILAVPGRRYSDFIDLVAPFYTAQCVGVQEEVLDVASWNQLRLVIARDPQVASDSGRKRDSLIAELLSPRQVNSMRKTTEKKRVAASSPMAVPGLPCGVWRIWRAFCASTSRASCSPTPSSIVLYRTHDRWMASCCWSPMCVPSCLLNSSSVISR